MIPRKIGGFFNETANGSLPFYSLHSFFIFLNLITVQELVEKLKAEAGLTDDQAKKAIETIKNFVVEKFPMLEGAVGNIFN